MFILFFVVTIAMLLAITGLGGNNATKDALNSNIQSSNLFAFYQAKEFYAYVPTGSTLSIAGKE
mgnify:CR=1 FL=1